MATIAEQLTSLANTKTAIKDAIVAKGVSVADTDPFSAYPAKIGEIQGGGGAPATKFGASVDTFLADPDENGWLYPSKWVGSLDFTGVTRLVSNVLQYKFQNMTGIVSANFSSVTTISDYGLSYAFYNSAISSADFSSLVEIGRYGMQAAFYGCSGLKAIYFPSLTTFGTAPFGSANSTGAFRSSGVTEIHFRADAQAAVEATSNYAGKWGATNASIIFDL